MRYLNNRLTNNSDNVTYRTSTESHTPDGQYGCRPTTDDNVTLVCKHGYTCCCSMCCYDNMYNKYQKEVTQEQESSISALLEENTERNEPHNHRGNIQWTVHDGNISSTWTISRTITTGTDHRYITYYDEVATNPRTESVIPQHLQADEEDIPDENF